MANKAYIRVSSEDQNYARQVESLKNKNIELIYEEKISGKNMDRPKLQEMLANITKGDIIFVNDFSRLARNTKDLLEIIEKIEYRGASIVSIKENIDTSTPTGMLMLQVIAAINQFERDNIRERQGEGIAIAKREGKYNGRKPIAKPKNFNEVYIRWKRREITAKTAMDELGLKRGVFYKMLNAHEEELQMEAMRKGDLMEGQTTFAN